MSSSFKLEIRNLHIYIDNTCLILFTKQVMKRVRRHTTCDLDKLFNDQNVPRRCVLVCYRQDMHAVKLSQQNISVKQCERLCRTVQDKTKTRLSSI